MAGPREGLLVLTLAALLLAGCGGAPQAGAAKPAQGSQSAASGGGPGDVDNGRQLFQSKGCIACHVAPGVPGASGTIGPNLTGIANTTRRRELAGAIPNTPENLRRWVQDPQSVKPGTMMPKLGLSDKEADDIVALLETLK